jgi:hypothetical protein
MGGVFIGTESPVYYSGRENVRSGIMGNENDDFGMGLGSQADGGLGTPDLKADEQTLPADRRRSGCQSDRKTELLNDDHTTVADARLIARAIRNHWPIPQEVRADVVEKLHAICMADDSKRSIEAARTLVAATAVNVSAERPATQKTVQNLTNVAIAGLDRDMLMALASLHRKLTGPAAPVVPL